MPYNNPSEANGSEIPVTAADLHAGSIRDPDAPTTSVPVSPVTDVVRPAGWVDADRAEEQQRQVHREAIAREKAEADQAAVEAEIDRRLAEARTPPPAEDTDQAEAVDASEVESVEADVKPGVASE
jgi:hypothetical protein